jgi:hypothetical protein
MISRRSVVLALGSMQMLARSATSQVAATPHRVGLLTAGAPLADASEIVTGLKAGFSNGVRLKHTPTDCRDSLTI